MFAIKTQNDSFGYNSKSELTSASLGNNNFAFDFDEIGNRETASEAGTATNYSANELNQYSAVGDFVPAYDADGNATLVKTATGTWTISYNGENRPVRFECVGTQTIVEMNYDAQGRRFEKKVTVAGTVTLHQRYVYRGYLQIACLDLTRAGTPVLWFVFWDSTQPTATRPLVIQKDGNWFVYGHDLTKNVCEVFGPAGYIRTEYSYSPFGNVTAVGDLEQPFQFSSEFYDFELDLIYYNYRHYSPILGRWLSRDPIEEQGGLNLYAFCKNSFSNADILGKYTLTLHEKQMTSSPFGIPLKNGETRFEIAPYEYYYLRRDDCLYNAWFQPPIEIIVSMWYFDKKSKEHEYNHLYLICRGMAHVEYEISGILFKKYSCIGDYIQEYLTLAFHETSLSNLEFDLEEYSQEDKHEVRRNIEFVKEQIKISKGRLSRLEESCVKK